MENGCLLQNIFWKNPRNHRRREGLTVEPLKHTELPRNLQENALTVQTDPASLLFAIPPANQQTTTSSLRKQHIVLEETYMFQVVVYDLRTFRKNLKFLRGLGRNNPYTGSLEARV